MEICFSPFKRPARLLASAAILFALLAPIPALAAANISGAPELFGPATAQSRTMTQPGIMALGATIGRTRTATADPSLLSGGEVILNLFDGVSPRAVRRLVKTRGAAGYTWFGRLPDDPLGSAVLVVRNGRLTGNVSFQGALYQIRPEKDGPGSLISAVDQAAFPPEACYDTAWAITDAQDAPSSAPDLPAYADSAAFIDVLVAYTGAADAASADIQAEIQLAVDETNQAYESSQIAPRLRLAGTIMVNYAESSDIAVDKARLQATGDGYMDEVHAERDRVGADVVALIVEDGGGYCGYGSLVADASRAFCVVARDCATGYYSFGHEIGHVQGARHDTYVDPNLTPWTYGHGYAYPAGRWRTVMAYNNACSDAGVYCDRLPYFSDPDNLYGGVSMGSPVLADNSRVLNERAQTVADFRQSLASSPPAAPAIVTPLLLSH